MAVLVTEDVAVVDWLLVAVDDTVEVAVDVCVLLSQTNRTPSALSCNALFNASTAASLALAFTYVPEDSTVVVNGLSTSLCLHKNTSVESIKVSYSYIIR